MVIAIADQGGLGLPDRDYYFRDDARSVEMRKQYVEHVAKMLTLAGTPAAQATDGRHGDADRNRARESGARRRRPARSDEASITR